ncbi:MAG: TlpA disulfide reductase family protein [Hyphomonadaceae bacterium]
MQRLGALRKPFLSVAALALIAGLAGACSKGGPAGGESAEAAQTQAQTQTQAAPAGESQLATFQTGKFAKLEFDKDLGIPTAPVWDADGAQHSLTEYKGKVLVLNMWATWCSTCVEEMPSLAKLQEAYAGKDVEVIPVAFVSGDPTAKTQEEKDAAMAEGVQEARDMLHRLAGDTLPFHYDTGFNVTGQLGSGSFPLTVIYNTDGQEVARLPWPADWASDEAKNLIDAVIAGQS